MDSKDFDARAKENNRQLSVNDMILKEVQDHSERMEKARKATLKPEITIELSKDDMSSLQESCVDAFAIDKIFMAPLLAQANCGDQDDYVSAEEVNPEFFKPLKDSVNPAHYKQHPSGVECIEIVRHCGFNIGNAIKYLWRCDYKNGVEDLEKAAWYIQDEIKKRKAIGQWLSTAKTSTG
jgi:hypothetical protein